MSSKKYCFKKNMRVSQSEDKVIFKIKQTYTAQRLIDLKKNWSCLLIPRLLMFVRHYVDSWHPADLLHCLRS